MDTSYGMVVKLMKEKALKYHRLPTPGKIAIQPTKPCRTQQDLSLAYTPGVAWPCIEIAERPEAAYDYTGRGNLVAVISDGTAVLGLGDIGPLAGKPVMEGKALLFKRFAGIDAIDLEVAEKDVDRFVDIVAALEPSFGGVNLEDIASPRCFAIEENLKARMKIPVFHDDQHGTAVIAAAAILNGLDIVGKDIRDVRVAMSGSGAAGVAIARHLVELGMTPEQIFACGRSGVLYEGRANRVSPWHDILFRKTSARTLADIMQGADIFIGVSAAGLVDEAMLRSMAKDPIILPMANPDPEVPYEVIMRVRPDALAGTGRSDYPNQVNNVLGFPAIFRGALDVRASAITDGMKVAASRALARIARLPVPEAVLKAYGLKELSFGRDYLIPKPFDLRVLVEEACAVAEAAVAEGVSRVADFDAAAYRRSLEERFLTEG